VQIGDQYATGFNEGKWQAMLTDAGYPKTPPPRTNPVGRPAVPAATTPSATSQSVAAPAAAPAPAKGTYPQ
jgi:hypothetical protein